MGGLDEVSRSIGVLEGKVGSIEKTQKAIFDKLEVIHVEQTNQKVNTAKISIKMGIVTAILTLGLIEGVKFYIKTHWGS